jgi:hypothetical protein
MGILVVAQAPTNSNIFENLLPLFINTAATGKAAYRGPAENEPNKSAREMELIGWIPAGCNLFIRDIYR